MSSSYPKKKLKNAKFLSASKTFSCHMQNMSYGKQHLITLAQKSTEVSMEIFLVRHLRLRSQMTSESRVKNQCNA